MKKKGLLETRGLSPLFVLFFFLKQWQHIKFDSFFSLSPPEGQNVRKQTREKKSHHKEERRRESTTRDGGK
jgi:hypothetical protein